jgi:hypothetical protein
MAGMPEKPTPSADELARMLLQFEAKSGGIWAFNEYQAELDDTFDAGEVTARLAGLAKVLTPAS